MVRGQRRGSRTGRRKRTGPQRRGKARPESWRREAEERLGDRDSLGLERAELGWSSVSVNTEEDWGGFGQGGVGRYPNSPQLLGCYPLREVLWKDSRGKFCDTAADLTTGAGTGVESTQHTPEADKGRRAGGGDTQGGCGWGAHVCCLREEPTAWPVSCLQAQG